MKIKDLHSGDKPLSAKKFFAAEDGSVISLRILKDGQLKEHTTKTPALLLCIKGEAVFKNENGKEETLLPGDFVNIEPMVKHWVDANQDSDLILIK